MAVDEHHDKLYEGVEAWNEWRRQHPDIKPDLSQLHLGRIDLRGADLVGANVAEADLTMATLRGANLSRADLCGTDLHQADFSHANVTLAKLESANLVSAKFDKADLSSAEIFEANLRDAKLVRADLRGADLVHADLGGAYLSEADLGEAGLRGAILRMVTGLSPYQVRSAENWEFAFYAADFLQEMGLPPDHNEKLRAKEAELVIVSTTPEKQSVESERHPPHR